MTDNVTPEDPAVAPAVDRRRLIGAGTGLLSAAALGGALVATATGCASASGDSGTPAADMNNNLDADAHLFKLTASEAMKYDGGTLQGAHEGNFPVLVGQQAAVYFVHLDVGGMREPHWHPTAWELNYIISGSATWTILGTHPDGRYRRDVFQAHQGDLVFAPQGFFHFFGNASTDRPLQVLIVFNSSAQEPNDDIGIVAAVNSVPREILAASFGVPVTAFDQIPTDIKPVVITKRKV